MQGFQCEEANHALRSVDYFDPSSMYMDSEELRTLCDQKENHV